MLARYMFGRSPTQLRHLFIYTDSYTFKFCHASGIKNAKLYTLALSVDFLEENKLDFEIKLTEFLAQTQNFLPLTKFEEKATTVVSNEKLLVLHSFLDQNLILHNSDAISFIYSALRHH